MAPKFVSMVIFSSPKWTFTQLKKKKKKRKKKRSKNGRKAVPIPPDRSLWNHEEKRL
jgi:hypothetical protein